MSQNTSTIEIHAATETTPLITSSKKKTCITAVFVVMLLVLLSLFGEFLFAVYTWTRCTVQYPSKTMLPLDFSWVPVVRTNSECMGWVEGYGHGYAPSHLHGNVSYGCWFYPVPSAELSVNVRRVLRANDRAELHGMLNLTSDGHDNLWCTKANELNYDSIIVAQSNVKRIAELVLCYGTCMTEPMRTACPGNVTVRKHGKRACRCNVHSQLMTCNPLSARSCSEAMQAAASTRMSCPTAFSLDWR